MTQHQVKVRDGETLLLALYRDGNYLEAACGGQGKCRRCRCRIEGDPIPEPTSFDMVQLSEEETLLGWRLACRFTEAGDYWVRPALPVTLPEIEFPPTRSRGDRLGLAVDLGTTTVSATLVDLDSGATREPVAKPNPQVAYGEEVVSRVRYALVPEHRGRLAELARHAVVSLASGLFRRDALAPEDLREVTLAGNATMTTLLLCRDPSRLARAPYEPGLVEEGVISVPGSSLGLPGDAPARFLPALGGQVGSDTTASILASGLLDGELPALLADVGTNGEVVVATEDVVLATSSAAGPAFEGGGVEKGSTHRPGAVERVDVEAGRLILETVGARRPMSWCGSGVLDVVAALHAVGDLDDTGRMRRVRDLPVMFTQADVRKVQLAKGAVSAAQRILCREAGVRLDGIRRLVLTGAFGCRLRPESARRIGLVPRDVPVESLLHGALTGAAIGLTEDGLARASAVAARVRHVPLGDRGDFEDTFLSSLDLGEMSGV
ncbi:MAG: ASKHA domain-containing protein [Planctomycetota bacterium]